MEAQSSSEQTIGDTPDVSVSAGRAPALASTGCCTPFDPTTWDEDEITWNEKVFVMDRVHRFFHVPLDVRRKVQKGMRLIRESDAVTEEALILCDEGSAWGADLYIGTPQATAGSKTVLISGTFLTKVYEGAYRELPHWVADMRRYVASKGQFLKRIYSSYTTCSRCAKAYGRNYVILFAEVDTPAYVSQA